MSVFNLPDLGEGLHEAEVVAWLVAVGDHVVADQPLVSVETDKAVVEIPAPHAGRIARLLAEPGHRLAVGAPLVEFQDTPHADAGAVVGEIPPVAGPAPTGAAPTVAAVKAIPAVRALAHRLGVDLASVTATGPQGQITTADVERAAEAAPAREGWEPLRGVRRAMAANMTRSGAEIVPATVTDSADIGDWPAGSDPTARLARAIAAACKASPALNAWYDGVRQIRRLHGAVDLGLAIDTEDGLFVPVIRDAGARTAAELRAEVERLKTQVRTRTVAIEALRGPTITLSNFGSIGGRYAALAIVPPQVAIVGAGKIGPQVVARNGQPAVRNAIPVSLTFDHRAVVGGEAARFLVALIADLERPD